MDALSRLLALCPVTTRLDLRCELAAPWVLDEPPAAPGSAPFHVIVTGGARVEAAGGAPVDLAAGDVVVFPRGGAHRLHAGVGEAGNPVVEMAPDGPLRRKGNAHVGGEGEACAILCGSFVFDDGARTVLVRALPPMLVVRASRAEAFPALLALVTLLQHETATLRPGSAAVASRLSGALFALILRGWLANGDTVPGLFAALADRRLGNAVAAMLEAPERAWLVADLARACHMSRATFARLFTRACRVAPAALLAQLRMAHAARLLQGGMPVAGAAQAAGYASEAAFQRVFKRHHGIGPGGYRRRALG
jgi:AraC family transcriptional activator of mtrCDE